MTDKMDLNENANSGSALRDLAEDQLGKSLDVSSELKDLTSEKIIHELQVHQIELEMQNEELKRVQLELEKSRDNYQALYDSAPVGYFTLTHKGLIKEINRTGAILLGMPRSKLINMRFGHFVAPESEDQWYRHIISALGHEEKQSCVLTLRRDDGSSFYAHLESARLGAITEKADVEKSPHLVVVVVDITERKRLEDSLERSSVFVNSLLDAIPAPLFYKDTKGRYIGFNKSYEEFFGKTRQELVGKSVFDIASGELAEEYHAKDLELFHNPGVQVYDAQVRDVLGAVHDVVFRKSTFVDPEGHVLGLIGVILDVTERKRMENELRKSKEEWEQTFNAVPDLITILSNDCKIIRVNRAMAQRLGLDAGDCIGLTCYETVHGTDAPPAFCPHLQLLGDGKKHRVVVHEKGLGGDYAITVTPLLDAGGHLFGSVHVARDITDQKSAELRLAEISEMNQQIIANSPVGIAIYQADGQCIVANDAIGEIIGGAKEYVLSQNFRRIKSWQDTEILDMAMKTLNTGCPTSGSISMVSSFGKTLWLSGSFNRFLLRDEPHLLLMFSDITGLKQTEQKLQELNEKLEQSVSDQSGELVTVGQKLVCEVQEHADTSSSLRDSEKSVGVIIESSPIGIFVIQNQEYIFANQALLKIFGLTESSEIIGKHPETPYRDDSGKIISDIIRKCVKKSELIKENELKVFTRNHRERHLNIWLQPTEFSGSPAVIGFIIDVSEELEIRSHLNQAQKMEALGSLAGGIAHDFNNVLFAITGNTELAKIAAPTGSKLNRQLDQVLRAARRAADLVKHILTFSRERELEKKPLLIGPIVNESLSFLRASITQNIEIRRNISGGLHTVNADPTQIHQVIMNLVTNAYHAMKDTGGTLDVSLEEVELTPDFVNTRPGMLPGTHQRLRVSDTGYGMSQLTLRRIFDPYFTTKELGQGTGLGLSVVDGIVREHGGAITVQSVPDAGTTFEVYFPVIMDDKISSDETEQVAPLGDGRILFVDDETMLTEMSKSLLEDLGYEVTTENNPLRALAKFEAHPYSFDLVITDMSMPKMTGLQLSMKISQIRRDIPIILITGFSILLENVNLSEYGIREMVQKPIIRSILAQTISRILTKQDC